MTSETLAFDERVHIHKAGNSDENKKPAVNNNNGNENSQTIIYLILRQNIKIS